MTGGVQYSTGYKIYENNSDGESGNGLSLLIETTIDIYVILVYVINAERMDGGINWSRIKAINAGQSLIKLQMWDSAVKADPSLLELKMWDSVVTAGQPSLERKACHSITGQDLANKAVVLTVSISGPFYKKEMGHSTAGQSS